MISASVFKAQPRHRHLWETYPCSHRAQFPSLHSQAASHVLLSNQTLAGSQLSAYTATSPHWPGLPALSTGQASVRVEWVVRGAGQLESLPRHLLEQISLQQASSGHPGPGEWLLSACVHSCYFLNSVAKYVVPLAAACAPAMEAGVGAIANPFLKDVNPLKFMPSSLEIPVEHLVESSRKCVAELGPEPMEALKVLLVIWAPSLWRQSSLAILQQSGNTPLLKILQDTSGSHVTETSFPSQS